MSLQGRLEAATVKATTTASRNKKTSSRFLMRSERWRRRQNAGIGRRGKILGKRPGKQEENSMPGWELYQRPIVKKLWINAKASEDRGEWMEEIRSTAKVVMTTRMRRRRCRKRGLRNNEDGVRNHSLVFEKDSEANVVLLQRRNFHVWFSSRSVMRSWGLGRFRAVALMSVLAEWHAAVMVGLLQEERELIEFKELAVGAESRVNSEHMQALLTNILQRHWEWQVDRRDTWDLGFKSHTLRSWPAWTCGRRSTWPHRPWCQGYRLAW